MSEITANGLRFFVVDEGEGTPVVLLHGFPDTAYVWRHQIAALVGAGYRANPMRQPRPADEPA
jgi:pimeloyl-ACP methyl ester carboxylesterase